MLEMFSKLGMHYKKEGTRLYIDGSNKVICNEFIISTAPYPGFPTDMQSQMMALLTTRTKSGIIIENVFEGRLKTSEMFNKMGADIELATERIAIINGVKSLHGEEVFANDLRGGAALIIAGLISEGETIVKNINYICRGYESIHRDIRELGGNIEMKL